MKVTVSEVFHEVPEVGGKGEGSTSSLSSTWYQTITRVKI